MGTWTCTKGQSMRVYISASCGNRNEVMAASLQGIIEISPPECRVRDIASASSFEYVCRSSVLVEYVHMEKAVGISTGMGCKLESVCVARDGRCAKLDVDRNEGETVGPRGDNERISFAQGE